MPHNYPISVRAFLMVLLCTFLIPFGTSAISALPSATALSTPKVVDSVIFENKLGKQYTIPAGTEMVVVLNDRKGKLKGIFTGVRNGDLLFDDGREGLAIPIAEIKRIDIPRNTTGKVLSVFSFLMAGLSALIAAYFSVFSILAIELSFLIAIFLAGFTVVPSITACVFFIYLGLDFLARRYRFNRGWKIVIP